jgi:hypothetical protein
MMQNATGAKQRNRRNLAQQHAAKKPGLAVVAAHKIS